MLWAASKRLVLFSFPASFCVKTPSKRRRNTLLRYICCHWTWLPKKVHKWIRDSHDGVQPVPPVYRKWDGAGRVGNGTRAFPAITDVSWNYYGWAEGTWKEYLEIQVSLNHGMHCLCHIGILLEHSIFWGNALLETNWRLDSAPVPQHKGSTLHLGVSGSADYPAGFDYFPAWNNGATFQRLNPEIYTPTNIIFVIPQISGKKSYIKEAQLMIHCIFHKAFLTSSQIEAKQG